MTRTVLLAAAVLPAAMLAACAPHDIEREALVGGDVKRGRVAMRQYACGTCHLVPGVTGADSLVGPPLNGIASRRFVGGVLPNTPENLVHWIQHPQQVSPLSAMPPLGVTERDARDITASLYTLR